MQNKNTSTIEHQPARHFVALETVFVDYGEHGWQSLMAAAVSAGELDRQNALGLCGVGSHRRLECRFDNQSDQEKFSPVWQKMIGKVPRFASV